MWSPFDISLEAANQFYTWGWKASFAGAVVTLLGVTLLFWGTRVRDRDFETQMGALNHDAASLHERAAQAELRVAELQKLAGPRMMNPEAFRKALEGKPKAHVAIWYLPDTSDG
jgi:hypothetical protein